MTTVAIAVFAVVGVVVVLVVVVVVAVVVDAVVADAMDFVVVIAVIAVFAAVVFAFAFVLSIEPGVGVDVVCVIVFYSSFAKATQKNTSSRTPRGNPKTLRTKLTLNEVLKLRSFLATCCVRLDRPAMRQGLLLSVSVVVSEKTSERRPSLANDEFAKGIAGNLPMNEWSWNQSRHPTPPTATCCWSTPPPVRNRLTRTHACA